MKASSTTGKLKCVSIMRKRSASPTMRQVTRNASAMAKWNVTTLRLPDCDDQDNPEGV
jgi:hypothetical protein